MVGHLRRIALLFGVGVWVFGGHDAGQEYFAQKVLLFGITLSLVVRTGFIFLGSALISSFVFVFYVFGLFLLVTAGNLLRPTSSDSDEVDNIVVRVAPSPGAHLGPLRR